jgi:hypothetical protein
VRSQRRRLQVVRHGSPAALEPSTMGSLIWSASLTGTARMEGMVVLGIAGELIVEQVTVKKISLIVGCGRGLALYHVRLIMEAVKEMPWHVRTLHCRTLDASATKQPMIRWPRRRATSPPTRHQPPSYRPVPACIDSTEGHLCCLNLYRTTRRSKSEC